MLPLVWLYQLTRDGHKRGLAAKLNFPRGKGKLCQPCFASSSAQGVLCLNLNLFCVANFSRFAAKLIEGILDFKTMIDK